VKSTLFNIKEVRDKALRMLREEVTEDYNHPSVMVSSIGNENASRPKRGFQH
jgi:beta-galactosidase/beta-glucuronidase